MGPSPNFTLSKSGESGMGAYRWWITAPFTKKGTGLLSTNDLHQATHLMEVIDRRPALCLFKSPLLSETAELNMCHSARARAQIRSAICWVHEWTHKPWVWDTSFLHILNGLPCVPGPKRTHDLLLVPPYLEHLPEKLSRPEHGFIFSWSSQLTWHLCILAIRKLKRCCHKSASDCARSHLKSSSSVALSPVSSSMMIGSSWSIVTSQGSETFNRLTRKSAIALQLGGSTMSVATSCKSLCTVDYASNPKGTSPSASLSNVGKGQGKWSWDGCLTFTGSAFSAKRLHLWGLLPKKIALTTREVGRARRKAQEERKERRGAHSVPDLG